MAVAVWSLAATACASAPPAEPVAVQAGAARATAGEGLYTAAQAEHGQRVFNSICSACHSTTEFRGRMFEITWMNRPVGDFFLHISGAMPQDRPGSLEPEEYASVAAYVLQLNGLPPGSRELPADPEALGRVSWR